MAVVGERKTITGSPSLVILGADFIGNARPVTVTNLDTANAVDLGGPAVASGSGFPLVAGAAVNVNLMTGDDLYAVSAGPSVLLAVLRGRS